MTARADRIIKISMYAYVDGNPISNVDPIGLRCFNFNQFANDIEQNRFDLAAMATTLGLTWGIGTMRKVPSELRACTLMISLVVTACAFCGFYFGARPALRYFGISEYAQGVALLPFLTICIACAILGLLVGLFMYPVVVRPFVSSKTFWRWAGSERSIKIPLIDAVLLRWTALLYGTRSGKHR